MPPLRSALSSLSARWRHLPRGARLAAWLVGTRLWVLGWMVLGTFFTRGPPRVHWAGGDEHFRWMYLPVRALDVWGRWDTMFYLDLARDGYPTPHPGGWAYHAAFFPLYPSLVRGLSVLLGGAPLFHVGLLLSQVMLVLAVVYLDKLVRLDRPGAFAELCVACLLAYPGSHFFSAVYPESTALFLGVFALYCVRTRREGVAALALALAVWARPNGWILCLPALLELCRAPDGRLRLTPRVLWLLVPVVAVLPLLGLHWQLYGDPLYFVHVQAAWKRQLGLPLVALFRLDRSVDYNLFALAALLLVGYALKRRERPTYPLLAGSNLLLPLSTGQLQSIHRFLGNTFPLFIFLADFLEARPRWRGGLLVLGLGLLAIFSFRWAVGLGPN
ncbi:MAG TPA: mannosyltransferase family protein [Cystobacter sp.]